MKNLCKKYGKRVKAFALTMVMALSLVQMVAEPETVKADTSPVDTLYVGDTAIVKSGNVVLDGVSEGIEMYGGTVTYDEDTQTLTLDGVNINAVSNQPFVNGNVGVYLYKGDLNIHIASPSKITIPAGDMAGIAGYYVSSITVTGEKLEIVNENAEDAVSSTNCFGIGTVSAGKITIQNDIDITLYGTGNVGYTGMYGVYASDDVNISGTSNDKVNVSISLPNATDTKSSAIECQNKDKGIATENSILNIDAPNAKGINKPSEGEIIFKDSEITMNVYDGIRAYQKVINVTFENTQMTLNPVKSDGVAINAEKGAVSVDEKTEIRLQVVQNGDEVKKFMHGIKAYALNIAGATLNIDVKSYALSVLDGDMTISSGIVNASGDHTGIAITGDMFVKGGTITAIGKYYGIAQNSGSSRMLILEGGTILAIGKTSQAVYANRPNSFSIDITNFSGTITGGSDIDDEPSWGTVPPYGNAWYNKADYKAMKFNGLPRMEGIVAENVVGVAGEEVGITVTGTPEGATITYGTTAENCTESASPKYKEVGEYTVYFEVKCEGYGTYKGSATITIKPYATGGAIEDLGDDSITMEDNVVYFDVPEEDEEKGFIYYQEMLPTAIFENKDALDAYINILTAGLNDGKVVDVPGTVNFEDKEANMLLAQNGTISVLNVKVDEFYNSAPVDTESVVILFKFHKENVIGKEFEEGESNIYFEGLPGAYIYAVYGVHAEIVTPVFGPVINEPEDTEIEVEVGDEVNFEVDVEEEEGLEYQYQWWGKEYGDDEFKPIEGATNPTFTKEFDTCDKVYEYKCIVTNDNGSTESAVFTVTVEHKLNEVKANESTCTATGNNAYYKCECGACFTDADGENATTEEAQTTAKKPHDYADTWTNDGTNHWHKCKNCTDAKDVAPHVDVEGKDYVCDVCEYVLHTHKLDVVPGVPATCDKAGNNAYYKCTVDGCDKVFFKDAEGKNPTTEAAEVIPAKGHDYADTWTNDGVNHWHKCNNCTATKDVAPHADSDKDNVCDTCKCVLHTHKLVEVPGVPATCDKPGKNTYYKCEKEGCGAFFKDAEGKNPTTEAAEVIPAKGHADANKDEVCDACKADLHKHALTEVPATNATCEKAGNKEHYKCNCGKLFADAEGKTALTLTDVTIAPTAHADKDGDMVCDACKAELHKHVLVKVPGVAATCTTPGIKEHYKCTVENCTDLFVDAEGKTTITLEATKIAAHGHDWSGEWTVTKEATATEEGKKETLCERDCGQKKVVSIPKTGEADDNGNVEKDAEVEAEAPIKEATLNNSKPELIGAGNIFTKEDKEAIERGEDARVWIEITKTDETTIKEEDKAKMEEEAADLVGEDATLTYFDVDLFKQVGNGEKEDIAKPGVAIKITIAIPEELLNHDATLEREYKIIRLHTEGDVSEVDVIEGEFNAETGEFSFETDRFSTYAIAYSDTSVEVDVPNTGENVFVTYTYVLLLISGLGLFFRARKAK